MALVLFVFLLGAGVLIWAIVEGVNANPSVVGSLLAAGISVAGGIGVASYSAGLQRREAAERVQREKMAPYYETVIQMVSTMAENVDEEGQARQEDIEALSALTNNMLLWSSPETIMTWTESMRVTQGDPSPVEAMLAFSRILRAIRAELGHKDAELDARDLLRVIINDIDDHIPAGAV
jgi:hypothetical protein